MFVKPDKTKKRMYPSIIHCTLTDHNLDFARMSKSKFHNFTFTLWF